MPDTGPSCPNGGCALLSRHSVNLLQCRQSTRCLAGRTQAILPSPDTVKLPAAARRVQHVLAPSGLEVLFPLTVMRIRVGLNLDVPLYWRIRFV